MAIRNANEIPESIRNIVMVVAAASQYADECDVAEIATSPAAEVAEAARCWKRYLRREGVSTRDVIAAYLADVSGDDSVLAGTPSGYPHRPSYLYGIAAAWIAAELDAPDVAIFRDETRRIRASREFGEVAARAV